MNRPLSSGPDDFDPADPDHWPLPPEPSARAWENTRTGITARLPRVTPGRRWHTLAKVGATAGLLSAGVLLAWGLWATFHPPAAPTPPEVPFADAASVDPLAGYDVLPIATASDVMISSVRGNEVRFGSINHPVPDAMPLASGADVTIHRGPVAGELSCPDPGGAAVYVMPPVDK